MDNYINFGFKNEESYNDFLNIMKNKVIYERKLAGFEDTESKDYDPLTMIEKSIELEIYNNINKHIQKKNIVDAWNDYYVENNSDNLMTKNKDVYENIFRKIYVKVRNNIWKPIDVINYIKDQERKLKMEY